MNEKFAQKFGDNIKLLNGFTDFNEGQIINGNRKMMFRKSYIYKDSETVFFEKRNSKIEILEVHDNSDKHKDTVLVIYLDPIGRLCFIIIKRHHPTLTMEEVIEKAESYPPQRLTFLCLFKSLYVFGVVRFRYDNFKSMQIAFGYDKSLTYNFKHIFPHKIRKRFGESTNKLSLLLHSGFVKVKKDDLLNKYIISSEINLPAYIKTITVDNLDFYYPLKFRSSDSYNKKQIKSV